MWRFILQIISRIATATAAAFFIAMVGTIAAWYDDPFVVFNKNPFVINITTETVTLDEGEGEVYLVVDVDKKAVWPSSIYYYVNLNGFVVQGVESLKDYSGRSDYYYKGIIVNLGKSAADKQLTVSTNGKLRLIDRDEKKYTYQSKGLAATPLVQGELPPELRSIFNTIDWSKSGEGIAKYVYIHR